MDQQYSMGPSTSYAHFSSNPSSTHSSPRSYPSDLEYSSHHQHHPMHSQSYPIPGSSTPFPPPRTHHRPPQHAYTAPLPLQVSTSTSSSIEHDPNESTARPGNAHKHAQFHSLPLPGSSGTADESNVAEDATGAAMKDYTSSTPGLSRGLSRPLTQQEQDRLAHLDKLKFFLATAPSRWDPAAASSGKDGWAGVQAQQGGGEFNPPHPALNRFLLPSQEFVTCVLWKGLYHITGTDIVRALVFRFEAFGRPVRNMKKFEEGVFSDLRNLKPGVDATLEEPKSPFLDLLFKYQCIRTQKKQKVFYWFSVPHDRLFLDALERDLKREKMGLEPTTHVTGEPALSFTYDPKRSLYEQFSKAQGVREGEGELEAAVRHATEEMEDADESEVSDGEEEVGSAKHKRLSQVQGSDGIFPMVSLFGGSPTYKQRKKRNDKTVRKGSEDDERGRGRSVGSNGSERYGSSVSVSRERVPRPTHASMLDEFGPGSLAAKAELEPSAAEMFHKQARGELLPGTGVAMKPREQAVIGEVGVYYEGQPAPPSSSGGYRERSQDPSRGEYALPLPPGYNTATFSHPLPRPVNQPQNNLAALGFTATSQYEAVSADGKVKAYVCPLFSCGRLFKRMEHLKRHLRTHTMERPFTCPRCNKKFSRSDNLNQHLKTHERAMANGGGGEEWIEDTGDSDVSGGGEMGSGGESEEDVLFHHQMFSQQGGMDVDMQMFDVNGAGGGGGGGGGGFNATRDLALFEVEVAGGVSDVQGDEEGLIMRSTGDGVVAMVGQQQQQHQQQAQEAYYPSAAASALFAGATNTGDFTDPQWATRGQQSPAVPSPPPGAMNHIRNPNRNSYHAPTMRPTPPASSSSSGYPDDSYPISAASLSAPSHKQAFDHAALYPPGMIDGAAAAAGTGPIRRHRSMTPSVARSAEQTRRPVTANGTDYAGGSPGSSSSVSSTRGYHPYATHGGYASSSRGGSTHSSPAVYSVPLAGAGEYPQGPGRRSESRNSSYGGSVLHEQMRMMNMAMEHQDPTTAVAAASFNEGVFRTESPASFPQTESPAPYNMDLPVQYASEAYPHPPATGQPTGVYDKQGQFVMNTGMPLQDQQQQQQQTQYGANGYYSHPQHVTM